MNDTLQKLDQMLIDKARTAYRGHIASPAERDRNHQGGRYEAFLEVRAWLEEHGLVDQKAEKT